MDTETLLGFALIGGLFLVMVIWTRWHQRKYGHRASVSGRLDDESVFDDRDLLSTDPTVNTDGTPMVAGSGVDIHGGPYGTLSHY